MSIDRGKKRILGVDVSVIDYEAIVSRVVAAARDGTPLSVSALAVHGVMTGALDRAQKYRLNRLDIVAPDGQPVRWALRILHGEALRDRVRGAVLTRAVCEAAARNGLPIYLFGSKPAVLDAFAGRLRNQWPDIVIAGCEASRFGRIGESDDEALNERIRASGARIVFVGLGCPRQEVFAFEHAAALRMPVLAVGAVFDFNAGVEEAPQWMQRAGLEWAFRLAQEPKRLWRRYLLLNPLYCLLLVAQRLGLLSRWFEREEQPTSPLRYG